MDGTCLAHPYAALYRLRIADGLEFLKTHQRPDGSWLPLWFGNQHMPDDENPTYGTARVLAAYRDLGMMDTEPAKCGIAWLLANQNADGGWGGGKGSPSSIEETALALDVLIDQKSRGEELRTPGMTTPDPKGSEYLTLGLAVNKGIAWLVEKVESGGLSHPTPIGFYFAKLWYFEKLYPIIFTVSALGRARKMFK
jgi:squalene-hopene/tetraprenyl-beta-curcumene cyclase